MSAAARSTATGSRARSHRRATGPPGYATPTVQYAVELGFEVAPIEAHVRTRTGRYLDDWYKRLRDAYVSTMADLGVTTAMGGSEFLEAMARNPPHP